MKAELYSMSDKKGKLFMRFVIFFFTLTLPLYLTGCMATKVVTVPMRVAGEVVGFVPVVGGIVEGVVDTTAGVVDLVPL
jgi:hypothetical protein